MSDRKHLANLKHEAFARKLAASLVSTSTQRPAQIYSQVYPVEGRSASSGASELMSRSDVINRIRYLVSIQTGPEYVSKSLRALSQANVPVWYRGQKVGKQADHSVRLQALQTILKTLGAFEDQDKPSVDNRQVNFHLHAGQAEDLRALARELGKLNEQLMRDRSAHPLSFSTSATSGS